MIEDGDVFWIVVKGFDVIFYLFECGYFVLEIVVVGGGEFVLFGRFCVEFRVSKKI